jgi:hypothetical protein
MLVWECCTMANLATNAES